MASIRSSSWRSQAASIDYVIRVVGEIPVVKVRKAGGKESAAVVGIVDVGYQPSTLTKDERESGMVAGGFLPTRTRIGAGEYLSVVTFGAYKKIKVDASYASIKAGDLLTSSATPGYAMKAGDAKYGTIIGKALAPLATGTGEIPVFVTLH